MMSVKQQKEVHASAWTSAWIATGSRHTAAFAVGVWVCGCVPFGLIGYNMIYQSFSICF